MSDLEFSDSEDEDNEQEQLFNKATDYVQQIHQQLSPTDLLELYAWYKQATVGRCNTPKPSIFQLQARGKWQAWSNLNDMAKEQAKQAYVQKLKSLDENWYETTLRDLQKYKNSKKIGWVVHSTMQQNNENLADVKTEFNWVQDANLADLEKFIKDHKEHGKEILGRLDEAGMGLIHWATDRNAAKILQYLLDCGANVNLHDEEKQTPLHYAAICGHRESIEILMKHGADWEMCDAEGQNCLDVASTETRQFIEKLL